MEVLALVAVASVYVVSAMLIARRRLRGRPHNYPYWQALWAILFGLGLGLIPAAVVGLALAAIA